MRAEFYRPEEPEVTLGVAEWDGGALGLEGEVREALDRVFRPSPVVVEDPSVRPAGSSGPAVIEPGSVEWFRAAAIVRGEQEGLSVRFASERAGGWDPAGAYVPLRVWTDRREGSPGADSLGTPRA